MSNIMSNTCCDRVLQSVNAMVVTLEFAIDRTVIRRYDADQENFKDALYTITPSHLRETGLPFDSENVLYSKKYILAFWEFHTRRTRKFGLHRTIFEQPNRN